MMKRQQKLKWWESIALPWRIILLKNLHINRNIHKMHRENFLMVPDINKISYVYKYIIGKNFEIPQEITKHDILDIFKIEQLYLASLKLVDVDPIKPLISTKKINLVGNKSLRNINGISQMKKLSYLTLNLTDISNISPIKKLTSLEELMLARTKLKSFDDLSGLVNLKQLSVYGIKKLNSGEALSSLVNLEELSIALTDIESISFVQNMKKLRVLNMYSTKIKDITPLINLKNLIDLQISKNVSLDSLKLFQESNKKCKVEII